MPTTTPLTDAITALTTYANTVTGKTPPDTTLSDAVATLASGYGGGSGWTTVGIAKNTEPNGAITIDQTDVSTVQSYAFTYKPITTLNIVGSPYLENYAFDHCMSLTTINAPSLTRIYRNNTTSSQYTFRGCSNIETVVLPAHGNYGLGNYVFRECSKLATVDFKDVSSLPNGAFQSDTLLRTLIIRRTSGVCSLSAYSANALGGIYNNPSQSTIYVPNALLSSYKTASNWSNAYSAGVTFAKIEGSYYETHYADGTPIS